MRPTLAIFLLLITSIGIADAQQKRPTTPKQLPKPAAAPTPAPTFDTLVPADTYILYGEVRGVGQFIRSSALNDLLDPVLKLAGPPKEFTALVRWLNAHSEETMSSRLLLATWPTDNAKGLPDAIFAIEFPTAEEATKFTVNLNAFLPKVLPPPAPESSPENAPRGDAAEKQKPPAPNFHIKRFGTLVVITPKAWTMKQLKPAGSKLLTEDANFRAAHNRFNAEPLFVYFDTKTIQRQEEESRKRWEQQRIEAQKQTDAEAESKKDEVPPAPEPMEPEPPPEVEPSPDATPGAGEPKDEPAMPAPLSASLYSIFSAFDRGESQWPDGLGLSLSYEGDSFDLRALLVNEAGKKADAIPFLSLLIAGPPVSLDSPNIFPADTELLAAMSLDLPQMYATFAKPRPKPEFITSGGKVVVEKEVEEPSPFAEIEKRAKINIKDDLLPLIGPEIAIRLPMNNMNILGLPNAMPPGPQVIKEDDSKKNSPVVAIAIKDREAMRTLMPKLIEAFGFSGANAFAQTERREDTEIISYANAFSYAFVGNFLVISGDPASTRYVVDSYLKHETLAADVQFRNSIRWQPKPQQGQIYISPVLMEGTRSGPNSRARVSAIRRARISCARVRWPNQSRIRSRTRVLDHCTRCTFRRTSC